MMLGLCSRGVDFVPPSFAIIDHLGSDNPMTISLQHVSQTTLFHSGIQVQLQKEPFTT
jgi:hypothetical protein